MSEGEIAASPQPHFIPGYAGFCPQLKYRSGHSYGSTTHKLLMDPSVSHADHLILSDLKSDDYKVDRSPSADTDIASLESEILVKKEALQKLVEECNVPNSHFESNDVVYKKIQNIPVDKSPISPRKQSGSPYFMDNDNPEKHIKQGFAGHIPYEYAEFGEAHEPTSHSALCKFTSHFRENDDTEEGGQCPGDNHHV